MFVVDDGHAGGRVEVGPALARLDRPARRGDVLQVVVPLLRGAVVGFVGERHGQTAANLAPARVHESHAQLETDGALLYKECRHDLIGAVEDSERRRVVVVVDGDLRDMVNAHLRAHGRLQLHVEQLLTLVDVVVEDLHLDRIAARILRIREGTVGTSEFYLGVVGRAETDLFRRRRAVASYRIAGDRQNANCSRIRVRGVAQCQLERQGPAQGGELPCLRDVDLCQEEPHVRLSIVVEDRSRGLSSLDQDVGVVSRCTTRAGTSRCPRRGSRRGSAR